MKVTSPQEPYSTSKHFITQFACQSVIEVRSGYYETSGLLEGFVIKLFNAFKSLFSSNNTFEEIIHWKKNPKEPKHRYLNDYMNVGRYETKSTYIKNI